VAGVERLPDTLLKNGLAERLKARRRGVSNRRLIDLNATLRR